MDWFDNWALTLAVFIPFVGMVIIFVIPKAEENLIKVVALLTTLLTAAVGIGILANFNLDDGGLQVQQPALCDVTAGQATGHPPAGARQPAGPEHDHRNPRHEVGPAEDECGGVR